MRRNYCLILIQQQIKISQNSCKKSPKKIGKQQMSKKASFLSNKQTVQLPSNLLSTKRHSALNSTTIDTIVNDQRYETANHFRNARLLQTSTALPNSQLPMNRYFRSIETPTFIGEKNTAKDKEVLYKRLSNIRGQNKEIGNLSFSKMLSRMVVLDDEEPQQPYNNTAYDHRMRQTVHVSPIPQRVFHMSCGKSNPSSRAPSRSINIEQQQSKKPSRKLFKKFYMPSSQMTQTIYLETGNPGDKYIYKDGKKVECKRIHNFYTSHMFRTGYDKCFRKTISTFKVPA